MATEKILVVDDQPEVGEAITDLLRSDGYAPEMSTDSVVAVKLLSAAAYDLVLSDIVMPGLTGLQLLSLVKARIPAPEVILVTGYSTRERAMEALEHGAFAYIEKPFDAGDLLERVKQALWKRKLASGRDLELSS
jgi:DNA-binding NtrC family response regulator